MWGRRSALSSAAGARGEPDNPQGLAPRWGQEHNHSSTLPPALVRLSLQPGANREKLKVLAAIKSIETAA